MNKFSSEEKVKNVQRRLRGNLKNVNLRHTRGILANLKRTRFSFQPKLECKLNHLASPLIEAREPDTKWRDEWKGSSDPCDDRALTLTKIERKRSKAVLRFWSKLKIRKVPKNQQVHKLVTSARSIRHAEETMNTQHRNELRDETSGRSKSSTQQISAKAHQTTKSKTVDVISHDNKTIADQSHIEDFSDKKKNLMVPELTNGDLPASKNLTLHGRNGNGTKKSVQSKSQADTHSRMKLVIQQQKHSRTDKVKKSNEDKSNVEIDKSSTIIVDHFLEETKQRDCDKSIEGEDFSIHEEISLLPRKNLFLDFHLESMTESEKEKTTSREIDKEFTKQKSIHLDTNNLKCLTPKSIILQSKGSKIPRAKTIVTLQKTKLPIKNKSMNSVESRPSMLQKKSLKNFNDPETDMTKKLTLDATENWEDSKLSSRAIEFSKISPDSELTSNGDKSCPESTDYESKLNAIPTITNESPAIFGSAGGDPSAVEILQEGKLNHRSRSYYDYGRPSNTRNVQDTWSDSRSSPEIRRVKRKLKKSLKYRKYIDTTSDDFDLSSDYSSENVRKKKNLKEIRCSGPLHERQSLTLNSNAKIRSRRGKNTFSFFDALFDIVFWPFLFFKTNR